MPEAAETQKAAEGDGIAKFWLQEIERAGKREKTWREDAHKILKRYRADQRSGFNILWSNVETLKPSVYARVPRPQVTQRFLGRKDPVAKAAADVLQGALTFLVDDPEYSFDASLKGVRDDNLLPGRGVARVRLEPIIVKERLLAGDDGRATLETGEPVEADGADDDGPFRERVASHDLYTDYVYWEDYREGPARRWEDVPWIAYRHLLGRTKMRRQFGQIANEVPLNYRAKEVGDDQTDGPDHAIKRAIVWEVWDKERRRRVWVAEGFAKQALAVDEDPLELQGFYPQANPLYAVSTTDSRTPVPEYAVYQAQAEELDMISRRIKRLVDALKVRGGYAAELGDFFARIMDGEENKLHEVRDWHALQDLGGLDRAVVWLPIEQIVKVLVNLFQERKELKQEIFEITGLSDLMRGSTDARETASAQTLKGSFGRVRLTPRREPMELFIRGVLRIKAEIIAEHFSVETLQEMTGIELPTQEQKTQAQFLVQLAQQTGQAPPEAMVKAAALPSWEEVLQLLRSDKLRSFNVDIETESTIEPDEQQEQEEVVNFLGASSKFFQAAGEVAQLGGAPMVRLLLNAYKAGARRFKMGRELEEEIDRSIDDLLRAAANPGPSAEERQAELDAQKQQTEMQLKEQNAQLEQRIRLQEAQMAAIIQQLEAEQNMEIKRIEAQADQEIAQAKAVAEIETSQAKAANDAAIARATAAQRTATNAN